MDRGRVKILFQFEIEGIAVSHCLQILCCKSKYPCVIFNQRQISSSQNCFRVQCLCLTTDNTSDLKSSRLNSFEKFYFIFIEISWPDFRIIERERKIQKSLN